MAEKTISQRILDGREAENRLNDEFLNRCFDHLVEQWVRGIVTAAPSQKEEILEAKRQIDAVTSVRKQLRVLMEDGHIAQQEQDDA